MLGRYLSDHGLSQGKVAKKVLRYLQGAKDLMLTYRQTNTLGVIGHCNDGYIACVDDIKFTCTL